MSLAFHLGWYDFSPCGICGTTVNGDVPAGHWALVLDDRQRPTRVHQHYRERLTEPVFVVIGEV